jgi:hypothetical protein
MIPNIIQVIKSRRIKLLGHVACTGDERNACRDSMGKPEVNKSIVRSRHRLVGAQ